jgi:hypothetical protein
MLRRLSLRRAEDKRVRNCRHILRLVNVTFVSFHETRHDHGKLSRRGDRASFV